MGEKATETYNRSTGRESARGRSNGVRNSSGRSSAIAARRRAERRKKVMRRRIIAAAGLLVVLGGIAAIIIVAANKVKDVKKLSISASGTAMTLTWSEDKGKYSHEIYREGEEKPIATVEAGKYTYTIEETKEAEEYTYIVKSVKGKKSSKGKEVSGYTELVKITDVKAEPLTTSSAKVSWVASDAPTSFKVTVSTNSDMSNGTVITVDSATAAKEGMYDCAIGSLQSNTTYFFTVTSIAAVGEKGKQTFVSPESDPVKMLTLRSVTLDGIDVNGKMIALTFDDGPDVGGEITERILDVFDKYQCYATFFQLGDRAESNAEVMQRMAEAGHEIGCHTYDHTNYGDDVTADNIISGDDAIEAASGVRPTAFRSPGGETTALIKETCVSEKMPVYYWSVDSRDWESRDAASVINLVENYSYDGAIVLMHNIYSSTAEAVESLVPWLIANGYQLVTVSQLIQAKTGQPPIAGVEYYDYQTSDQ